MSVLQLSTGILDHSSFSNCSRSLTFEGCLLPTAVLRLCHRRSMGFRSGLIAGHFRTLQCFVLTLSGCFLKCAMGHCPAGRPMSSDGDPAFWHWALHCAQKWLGSPQISWCHAHSHTHTHVIYHDVTPLINSSSLTDSFKPEVNAMDTSDLHSNATHIHRWFVQQGNMWDMLFYIMKHILWNILRFATIWISSQCRTHVLFSSSASSDK